MLDRIERTGNKMPHPAVLFLALCVGVIILSQALYWLDVKATYEVVKPPPAAAEQTYYGGSVEPTYVGPTEPEDPDSYELVTETATVQGLLTADGVRYLFTSFVSNFRNFAAVAIIFVVMIGVGLAEASGLIAALIRKLVGASSRATLTMLIVFLGVISSIASDAGYLVLIPLGAAAFASVGRHPLAGIAAAFAGVAAGFGVNVLITPLDGVLTEITNEAARGDAGCAHRPRGQPLLRHRLDDLRHDRAHRHHGQARREPPRRVRPGRGGRGARDAGRDARGDARGRGARACATRSAGTLGVLVPIILLTAIPGAPLRNPETDRIIGDSPFMDSLIVIIAMIFLAAGWAYGRGAGTIKTKEEVINSITKSWASLASLLFLFLLIAQFIAYFNYSNMAEVAAVKLGDVLENLDIGAIWLLIGVIFITIVVDLIIPQAIAKWALLAPIFVPLFLRLDIAPQTVLAAYRVGDSPANVITPLMAYFPLIVIFTQRYKKDAGIGTVVSMMLPYAVFLSILWILFFVVWYVIGIPLGPGSPLHT